MDQYVLHVAGAIESLVEHMAREEPEDGQKSELVAVTVPQTVPMPRAILANTEPYMHGEWRKEPYLPRSALLHVLAPWQACMLCSRIICGRCYRNIVRLSRLIDTQMAMALPGRMFT